MAKYRAYCSKKTTFVKTRNFNTKTKGIFYEYYNKPTVSSFAVRSAGQGQQIVPYHGADHCLCDTALELLLQPLLQQQRNQRLNNHDDHYNDRLKYL